MRRVAVPDRNTGVNPPANQPRSMMRRALSTVLLACAAANAAAQPCTPYPETFAQEFFRNSYAFFNESPAQVDGQVTPQLLHKLQDERDCVARHGRCRLLYDPWLGTQDGSIGRPVQFRRESRSGDRAAVVMSYPAPDGAAPRAVKLLLRKAEGAECWQLEDLITPRGESVAALLQGPGS